MCIRDRIKETFGGRVTEILTPPMDCYAAGSKAGEVTDDFSMAYMTLKAIINHGGEINQNVVEEALLDWSSYPQYAKCAGPTTRVTIARLKGEETPVSKYDTNPCINSKASNGAGMKMGPIGLLTPGDLDAVSYTHLDVYKRQGDIQCMTITAECIPVIFPRHLIFGKPAVSFEHAFGQDNIHILYRMTHTPYISNFLCAVLVQKIFEIHLVKHSFHIGHTDLKRSMDTVSYTHLDVYKRQVEGRSANDCR